ncbi:hypothetical protein [Chishuiella sp.]|uniref:hypothetical protein n=1 Tax=Chishuiella sp. TaxID=1969467 RepID=UPI0028AEF0C7|nr:hypothetical protein [Chishuiella sp.]
MIKITLCLTLFSSISFAQIGINTTTPQKTLHVNGTLQLTKELNVGGDSITIGNSGTSGQILTSQGSNKAPIWDNSITTSNGIQKLVGFSLNSSSLSGTANTFKTITYDNINHLDSNYLTYDNSSGTYTVNQAGYYNIDMYTYITFNGEGVLTLNILKNSNLLFNITKTYIIGNDSAGNRVSGISYLNAGDTILTQEKYSSSFTIKSATISFTYLGQ